MVFYSHTLRDIPQIVHLYRITAPAAGGLPEPWRPNRLLKSVPLDQKKVKGHNIELSLE